MADYVMPPEDVRTLLGALAQHGVGACVGGGWAVDALVGQQTREHSDLDLWVDAVDLQQLFEAMADQGVDRVHPWPGDRPWNFVLHDGGSRRVDLHFYEALGGRRLRYGSAATPYVFMSDDLSGQGMVGDLTVRCESPDFVLRNHTGYEPREVDRHDVTVLCERWGLPFPMGY
jgi:lincosamide nucleotidyltransferase A/C/D/E